MYYYVGYCRTIIILLGEGPEGEVGRGRGPRGRLAGCRLRGVSPRALAARGSRLAAHLASRLAPRLVRLARVYKGFIRAVTVTGAAADAVTVAVAVRGSGEMRFPETERETAWRFPETYSYQYYRTLVPSPRRQDPDCRPVPTHVILTRTIPPDSDYRVITGYSMDSMDSMVSGYIPCIFQGFHKF